MLREAPCGTVACSQPARETSTAADREVINFIMADAPSPEGIGAALETERPGRRVSAKTRPGAAPLHGPYATDSPRALSTRVRIFYHFYVIHITHRIFQRPGAEPADAQLHSAHARLARAEGDGLRRAARRRLPPARRREPRHGARQDGRGGPPQRPLRDDAPGQGPAHPAVRPDPPPLRAEAAGRRPGAADRRR